ncbi:hypothetical protein [Anabaena sp. CCY 0017]|uniref:hypothetical protein n=1 Tax=Anabaena sp. CCY 0017 TaxID=3103866 RepID=UPI0039C71EF2
MIKDLHTKGLQLAKEILAEQGFSEKNAVSKPAIFALNQCNFFAELEGLAQWNYKKGSFGYARYELFKSFCWLIYSENQPAFLNEIFDKGIALIKESAQTMYEADGDRGMRDPLIWLFIPKKKHRIIDHAFDGIGEWRK